MLGFVIKRTDRRGGFVAIPGSHHSYTNMLSKMRIFPTEYEANRERCVENEVVVPVEHLLKNIG